MHSHPPSHAKPHTHTHNQPPTDARTLTYTHTHADIHTQTDAHSQHHDYTHMHRHLITIPSARSHSCGSKYVSGMNAKSSPLNRRCILASALVSRDFELRIPEPGKWLTF